MSSKVKINPKKVKKEKIKKGKNKENVMTDIENDYVPPIDSYSEQLLPNNAFIFSQEDEDFKRILELSRKEFEEKNINNKDYLGNLNIFEKTFLDTVENDKFEQERIEQERIELDRIEQERIEQERIELDRIEQERIDKLKSDRKNSLLNFSNRINKLIHVKEDKKIKELIDIILEKYFNLEIDTFKLNKKDYIDLYKIIDTYYEIPSSKNLKTAISKEENELVRTIFLK